MVIKINKRIEVIKIEKTLILQDKLQKQIEDFWKKQVEENSHLFNGEVYSVTKFEELPDKMKIYIQKTNYAHYLMGK